MGDNLRDAVCTARMEKIRADLRKLIVPDWHGNVLLNAFFDMYALCTDCCSGTQIDDIVVMGIGQVIHPSWLWVEKA